MRAFGRQTCVDKFFYAGGFPQRTSR